MLPGRRIGVQHPHGDVTSALCPQLVYHLHLKPFWLRQDSHRGRTGHPVCARSQPGKPQPQPEPGPLQSSSIIIAKPVPWDPATKWSCVCFLASQVRVKVLDFEGPETYGHTNRQIILSFAGVQKETALMSSREPRSTSACWPIHQSHDPAFLSFPRERHPSPKSLDVADSQYWYT